MELPPFDAVLFDLDGVLTPTADVHMHAWQRMFTEYLDKAGVDEPYREKEYYDHIDGKPRYDGVRSFLASRGLQLPEGDPSDPPDADTICGLGNRKNDVFAAVLAIDGVQPYPGSVAWLDELLAEGKQVAVVSSSRNARPVLQAAGLADRFDVVVDGLVAAAESLSGKPAPDTFLHAARQLDVAPARGVVVEDALSGVQAGRAGDFGLVIGVDRGTGADRLRDAGASVVVADLGELVSP